MYINRYAKIGTYILICNVHTVHNVSKVLVMLEPKTLVFLNEY